MTGPPPAGAVARRLAGAAAIFTARRMVVTAMGVVGTAAVARLIGVGAFGQLSSALAAALLADGVSDFGFSLVLGRDLGLAGEARGRLLRAGVQVQLAWSLLPTLAMVALAFASGATSTRGLALLVLAPAVTVTGLGGVRQLFLALYQTRRLAAIDIATNAAQLSASVVVAVLGGGAVGVAAVVSVCSMANAVAVAIAALPLVNDHRPTRADRMGMIRRAFPLGCASLMASVYFTIDLVLLGWLVDSRQLGNYAAACKILSVLVILPGLLMSVALPALAISAAQTDELRALATRLLHWLAAVGLPLCVGVAIFAAPLARVTFGPRYGGAVPLIRILAAAAAVSLLSNLFGTLLIAVSAVRPMLVQNGAAIVLNVAGNLLLAPRFGVTASAWLTLATEVVVCAASFHALRARFRISSVLSIGARPAIAVAGLAATGLALAHSPLVGVPAATCTFVALLLVLRAWPDELQVPRFRMRG